MSDKSSLRIDWFDGTLIEDTRLNAGSSTSQFADEDAPDPEPVAKPQVTEKKPIGFKRLLDISYLNPPVLTLEVSHRPGFWNLLEVEELKGDFIVLIIKVLANVYQSLEPGEKSKIVTQLRTRFEKSLFLQTLKIYVEDLPNVRIVEKRMNLHLWDDAESFYVNLISLCDGILNLGNNRLEFLKEIHELLEITETSALGVKEAHTERFSEDLFIRIHEIKSKFNDIIEEMSESTQDSPSENKQIQDTNHFKNLDIFPKRDDLLGNKLLQIKPNIINGAYPSVAEYLDLQFKLLREDCFGPLREGICKYMENPSKRRHENIRVYPKVRVLRTFVSNNKVGHLVDIAWKDRMNQALVDSKKYAYNKQLMFGSLLLFTCDNFETVLCATVLDSNLDLLHEGYVAVSFQNPVSNKVLTEAYLMVESEVFFEPYHRVLKVLQNSRLDDIPMKKYIVDVQTQTQPPAYITPDTMYTLSDTTPEQNFPVLDLDQWPETNDFDASQMDAYKFALTREFAVIQGPPGTGKTFLGVKIASTLLKNLSLEGTPMLVICYTNHALDQFLEGVLNTTTSIIRLGSQSKSKVLEPYNLHNLRMKMKSKYSYLYANKRGELERVFKQMTELQSEIEKCEKEMLSYNTIKAYFKIGGKMLELKKTKEDPVISWLFGHLERESEEFVEDEEEDWEKQFDDVNIDDKIETCFSEQFASKEIDSMLNSIKYVKDVTDDPTEMKKMMEKFESHIDKVKMRLNCFRKYKVLGQREQKLEEELEQVSNLYNLNPDQRWRVYYAAVHSIKSKLISQMNDLVDRHNTCSQELDEVSTLIDGEVMKTVRVVGVTTTTAARRHDLMKKLLSPIVIVEEAAEVLEAHIVASLTNRCQHLILIGDHKQLRPTAAHYKLAKDYNLEISLFERMIRNGVHARTLAIQRRMRPNIAELLVPIIYEKLDSHPNVYRYPNVRGIRDNLYFYSHSAFEDSEGMEDSWSHKNSLEASWCVALADYLRQMKYNPEEITILATYTGQASLIKQMSRNYSSLRDVKITVVDNYQGEENRIVILSLVRSNREGRIGFLSAANRICVALSRAKEGFYIFGNMGVLKSASAIWRQINDKLVSQNAIGNSLTLRCSTHKDRILSVTSIEDFDKCLKGTCLKICCS